jgi:hypothetical protein
MYEGLIMLFILLLYFFFTGCTSTSSSSPLSIEMTDRATLSFLADGKQYSGVATLPEASAYSFQFNLPEGTEKFIVHTCHREVFFATTEKQINYKYIPANGIENAGQCLLVATAFTNKGIMSVAYVDFIFVSKKPPYETLKAGLYCNDSASWLTGGGFCQVRSGLIQKIALDGEGVFAASGSPKCNEPKKVDLTYYELIVSPGLCTYLFGIKGDKIFRLITYGYSPITP